MATLSIKNNDTTEVAQLLIDVVGTDEVGTSKITIGAAGVNDGFVSAANPLPVTGVLSVDDNGSSLTVDNGGTFAVQAQAATSGGTSQYSALSTAAVLSAEIKASAGQVYGVHVFNNGANEVFLRLYNQTGAPLNTDNANIVYRAMVPGDAAGAGMIFNVPTGMAFGTGIGIRVTGAVGDTDATALAANEVMINVLFK